MIWITFRGGAGQESGKSLEEFLAGTSQVAEGVKSCQSILELARRHGVDVPLTEHVVRVVHDGLAPRDMVASLMGRGIKAETA